MPDLSPAVLTGSWLGVAVLVIGLLVLTARADRQRDQLRMQMPGLRHPPKR